MGTFRDARHVKVRIKQTIDVADILPPYSATLRLLLVGVPVKSTDARVVSTHRLRAYAQCERLADSLQLRQRGSSRRSEMVTSAIESPLWKPNGERLFLAGLRRMRGWHSGP